MERNLPYDERDAIAGIANDDPQAFATIFHHHFDTVYSAALTLLKDPALAEDTCQQVFAVLWERRHQLSGVENLAGYLYIMARNLILGQFRRSASAEKYRAFLSQQMQQTAQSPEEIFIGHQQQALLEKAIANLPPKQQQVYRMSRHQGLAHKEIAETLGISVPTVKEYISLSVTSIKKYLSQYHCLLVPLLVALLLK